MSGDPDPQMPSVIFWIMLATFVLFIFRYKILSGLLAVLLILLM